MRTKKTIQETLGQISTVSVCMNDNNTFKQTAIVMDEIDGLNGEMLVALGENEIKTLDDLADLANDELIDIIGKSNLSEEAADKIIMLARAHWFEDEETEGDKKEN